MVKDLIKICILLIFILSVMAIAGDFEYQQLTSIVNPFTGTGDIVRSTNQTGNNWSADYFFGYPQDGAIGSVIIYSSSIDKKGNVNVTCTGLVCTYPGLIIRLATSSNVIKYCTINSGDITITDETHNVVYTDSTCVVKKTDMSTYIKTDLSPGGLIDIFNAMAHSGTIEVLKGVTVENKVGIKVRKNIFKTDHLVVVSGMNYNREIFPNITIQQGEYVYIRDIVNATKQNSSAGDKVEFVYKTGGAWAYDNHTGLNLTHCDDGTNLVPCSNPTRYRRHFICISGFSDGEDYTEIHQLAASNSVNYPLLSSCLDADINPLTYSLPEHYRYTCSMVWAYCGRASATDWTDSFIDLRQTKVGTTTGIIEEDSVFKALGLYKDGTVNPTGNFSWNGYSISNVSLGAGDIDRDLPSNCSSGYAMIGFQDNMSAT